MPSLLSASRTGAYVYSGGAVPRAGVDPFTASLDMKTLISGQFCLECWGAIVSNSKALERCTYASYTQNFEKDFEFMLPNILASLYLVQSESLFESQFCFPFFISFYSCFCFCFCLISILSFSNFYFKFCFLLISFFSCFET